MKYKGVRQKQKFVPSGGAFVVICKNYPYKNIKKYNQQVDIKTNTTKKFLHITTKAPKQKGGKHEFWKNDRTFTKKE